MIITVITRLTREADKDIKFLLSKVTFFFLKCSCDAVEANDIVKA